VGGVVVRRGDEFLRWAPPLCRVRSRITDDEWVVTADGHGTRVEIVGRPTVEAHVLPVPVPSERSNADTDLEYLAADVSLSLHGRRTFSGYSQLGTVETGHRPGLCRRGRGR
jgi:tocopherol cyclase